MVICLFSFKNFLFYIIKITNYLKYKIQCLFINFTPTIYEIYNNRQAYYKVFEIL